ncbi:hypothetical protein [Gracilibacillus timonensis]|uniref:hypothetical protein n=1 Tax=Gracilibacillus timonensis TaxID=1816696 RepID=UPI00082598D7|nr:hypothetical protein [Gracilibacillus timonensis]
MWKDEFKKEDKLKHALDQYHVTVPRDKLAKKITPWQRLIQYLGSPAQDPFEKATETTKGLHLTKVIPLGVALVISIIQLLIFA